ncbi:MAG TPA: NAD(P)H-dependent oxidoreductase [Abditibacteriaceae bacterium]|jgi:FMN reductase
MEINILAVDGNRTPGSSGSAALGIILQAARTHGANVRLLDLGETDLPMFRAHDRISNEAVDEATEAVNWADVLILGTPDYHGSMSGAMKNFLDHFWSEFAGKLFGYVCTSHEKGLTVMDQMRTAVRQCYGWSLPYGTSFEGSDSFDEEGRPNAALAARLNMMGRDLAVYGRVIRTQFQEDLQSDASDTFAARYRPREK